MRERGLDRQQERERERERERRTLSDMFKFYREPVATVTEKVADSCGWRYPGNRLQWPNDAVREGTAESAQGGERNSREGEG